MEQTPNFSEQLDAYLLGQMPEQEAQAFASRAEQDPLHAQELRLQQDIVAGLRRARTAQLKARLNQIPTPPAAGMSVAQWVGIGSAATVLVAGGIALYLSQRPAANSQMADTGRLTTETYAPAQPAPAPETVTPAEQAPQAASAGTDMNTEVPTLTEARTEPAGLPQAKPEVAAGRKARPLTYVVPQSKPVIEPEALEPIAPDEEAEDAGLITRPGIGQLPSGKVVENNEVKTKPEVVIKESDVLAYQYFDNRLFLYGSFGDAIYEVIELVSAKEGRRLFVFYKDRFYRVDGNVRDITPMSEVTDPKLAAELILLRKKRID